MYDKLITINFDGGMGGEFFSHLLTSALSNTQFTATPSPHGKYIFSRKVETIIDNTNLVCPQNPQLVFAIHKHKKIQKVLEDLILQPNNSRREQHLTDHYLFYLYCKDENEAVLIDNIHQTLRRMIPVPESFRVMTFHNLFYDVPGLSLNKIFPGSINIKLEINDITLKPIFNFFRWYKNQTSRKIEKDAVSMRHVMHMNNDYQRSGLYEPNENVIHVDELFFGEECDNLERNLSQVLNTGVHLDRTAVQKYKSDNKSIILEFFNLDNSTSLKDLIVLDSINKFLYEEHQKYYVDNK